MNRNRHHPAQRRASTYAAELLDRDAEGAPAASVSAASIATHRTMPSDGEEQHQPGGHPRMNHVAPRPCAPPPRNSGGKA
jgi:hypothetical protein